MANKKCLIDVNALVDTIEDIDWYHVNKKGKLCNGANPANNTPIYKAFDICNAIKNAPTVDAVEVVHSWWGKTAEGYRLCHHCKVDVAIFSGHKNYCPNCGAKMDGDGNG